MKKSVLILLSLSSFISVGQITTQTVGTSSAVVSNSIITTYTIRTTNTLMVNDNMTSFLVSGTSSVNFVTSNNRLEISDSQPYLEAYASKLLNTNIYDSIRVNFEVASSSNSCAIGIQNNPYQNVPIVGTLLNFQTCSAKILSPNTPTLPTTYSLILVVDFPAVPGNTVYLKGLTAKSYYTSVLTVTAPANLAGITNSSLVNSFNVFVSGNIIYSNADNNSNLKLCLTDLNGKLVFESFLKDKITINLLGGIYFLSVFDEQKQLVLSRKVVIED